MGSSAHPSLVVDSDTSNRRPIGKSDVGVYQLLLPAVCPFIGKLYTFHRGRRWRRSSGSSGLSLDSVGIGELPDAAEYGDTGRNTLGHIAKSRPLALPNLVRLGLANIAPLDHLTPPADPEGCYGKGATHSPGKDTTTGHWEMAGILAAPGVSGLQAGFPARADRAVRARHWPQNDRQQARLRHRDHQRTGRGARAHGVPNRVHLGR